jgi:hypothetical protein
VAAKLKAVRLDLGYTVDAIPDRLTQIDSDIERGGSSLYSHCVCLCTLRDAVQMPKLFHSRIRVSKPDNDSIR